MLGGQVMGRVGALGRAECRRSVGGVGAIWENRGDLNRAVLPGGESGRMIARRLDRHYSVVNREIARNGGRSAYRATQAPMALL
ncbi:MAG: helix-turn-helix domain-containing protein [Pseudonocardiaceae bacterium]